MTFTKIRVPKVEVLLATLLLASTLAVPAVAKDKPEPFSAGAQFSEVLSPSTDPNCQPTASAPGSTATGTISGSGLATNIGFFTVSSVDCVRSTNPYALTPPFTFSSTSFVLTATNGDKVVISYSGTAQPSSTGLFVLTGQFTFVSGTGEFKKVKGGGTLTGVEDISSNPARGFVTLNGEISY